MEEVVDFMRCKHAHLDSFTVELGRLGTRTYSSELSSVVLLAEFWASYHKYLSALLEMMDQDQIMDGYLHLNAHFDIDIKWSQHNVAKSLQIAQLIVKLQTTIHQHNERLEGTDCNEKIQGAI